MNELTIHGNITDSPTLRYTDSGTAIATFSVAVNRRRFDRTTGQWTDMPPVFHRVVTFRALAENAAACLDKGTTVTVTGQLADDSWTPEGGRKVYRTVLQADDVAVSLRFATAQVDTTQREQAEPTEATATS